jgi:uncharacterized membrane protein (UPF0136 family)
MEDDSDDRDEFYGNVFHLNQCLLYIIAAGCLMIVQPLTKIWMGADFQESMRYAPILIYSSVFSCFTTFMGSIYLASNKTKRSLVTSLIAGAINITINVLLIPRIGLYGPPISTVVSYLVVFIVRAYDSRKIIPFNLRIPKMITNNALLLSMTLINVMQFLGGSVKLSIVALPILFIIVTAINIKPVWNAFLKIMPAKIRAVVERIGTVRLIALAFAAAVFAVLCWVSKGWLLVAACAAVTAFGVASGKDTVKLGGAAALFLMLWISSDVSTAFLALLVLSAIDYLRRPDSVTCAVGCVCLTAVAASVGGGLAGVFCALIIIITAAVCKLPAITDFLKKNTFHK